MAHIEKVVDIKPIEGADAIEVVQILNWKCVAKKGEFRVGELVIYCEIDSWIPMTVAPFLQKGEKIREYNGVPGNKLKTIRLRGQLSQGLVLPVFEGFGGLNVIMNTFGDAIPVNEGDDVTDLLGIQKWEAPENPPLGGQTKGTFPSAFPKTDQERIQNIRQSEFQRWKDEKFTWEVQEKLEGSSMTVFMLDGVFGVCSRNQELKDEGENTFWTVAKKMNLEQEMRAAHLDNIAIQGELVGPGIQGNIYGLSQHMFYPFEIVKLGHEKVTPIERRVMLEMMNIIGAPVMEHNFIIHDEMTIDNLINLADGKSVMGNTGTPREGLVFKCNQRPELSFKVISNQYLEKQK